MARHARIGQAARLAVALAAGGALLAGCTGTATGPGRMATFPAGQGGMMGASSAMLAPLTCPAPADLPGQRVTVALSDMGMSRTMGGVAPMGAQMSLTAQPTSVRAGEVTLVVDNLGWRTHEVVVLPLAKGAAAGQRVPAADGKVDESGSLGEASSSCAAGEGEGIASGAVGWVTLTLAPGHYELVCNLTNHYANGMRQELVVAG